MLTRRFWGTYVTSVSPIRTTAGVRQLEAGDHSQQGRLAAAARAEEELALAHLQRHVVDGLRVVEALADPLEDDAAPAVRHAASSAAGFRA